MTQRQQDFADALTTYRAAMAGFLKSSLALMAHTAGPQTAHTGLDAATRAELERDPFHVFRLHAALLVRKARLHVIAVLHANRNSNLHSLAVQMRPAPGVRRAGRVDISQALHRVRSRLGRRVSERRLPSDHAAPHERAARPRLSSGVDRQGRSTGRSPKTPASIRIRQGPEPGRWSFLVHCCPTRAI